MDEADAELGENDPLVLPTRRARRRLLIDA
jgi:hypothetical protein